MHSLRFDKGRCGYGCCKNDGNIVFGLIKAGMDLSIVFGLIKARVGLKTMKNLMQ